MANNIAAKSDLNKIARDNKSLTAYVASTIAKYNTLHVELHQAACMVLFHSAQYRECHALNVFYSGLHVNDQTALRVWIGRYGNVAMGDQKKNFMAFTAKDGFKVIKGVDSKDKYTIDTEEQGKLMLLALPPFYTRNVRDPATYDLEKLLEGLLAAVVRTKKRADDTGIKLPANIAKVADELEKDANAEIIKLHGADPKSNLPVKEQQAPVQAANVPAKRGRKPANQQAAVH